MFKFIRARDLFSWENLYYEVKSGISQIQGINYDDGGISEGSGKSSTPNILCWVLYGRIPKDARVDEVIRQGCKGGWGEVELESGVVIKRSRNPNTLSVTSLDGQSLIGKDSKETQLIINKIIGLDFDAFCQTVYFAQNYPNKFLAANENDKAKILSEVQDLTVFDRGRKRVQELLKVQEAEFRVLEAKKISIEADIKRHKSNAELIIQFIDRFEQEKQNKIKYLADKHSKLVDQTRMLEKDTEGKSKDQFQTSIDEIDRMLESLAEEKFRNAAAASSVAEDRRKLVDEMSKLRIKIGSLKVKEQNTAKLLRETSDNKVCPTCKQSIHEEMSDKTQVLISGLTDEYLELSFEIGNNELEMQTAQSKFESLKDNPLALSNKTKIEQEIQRFVKQKATLSNSIQELTYNLKLLIAGRLDLVELDKEIEKAQKTECTNELDRLEGLDAAINASESELTKVVSQLVQKKNHMDNLEILKNGFREVKQYVFQSLLRELSIKTTSMASELYEVPIKIEFSNESDDGGVAKIHTQVTVDGVARSLGLLSGGQYKRVELAVDLTLASIVANRSSKALNFRILDEPLQNLSEASKIKVIGILEKLKGSTIIVEHDQIIKSIIHNVFNIEYRNGVSRAA